jgi:hypothetical protein
LQQPGQHQNDETGETDVDEPIAEGLGSNDAAKSPNENAVEHANEHATDNEHGQNGEEHGSGPPEGKGKDKDK